MSEIQQFYKGQNIFITGGTGFTGKILLEKLLRSCPEIETIYILMRSKKNKTIQERLSYLTNLAMFEPLRSLNPNFAKKIVPLRGDAVKPDLGLSLADRELIINEVSVIFHVAATTKFDEPLKVAVDINVNSVLALIDICKQCKQLKAAVYVSTAFSNCIYSKIEEKIYPMPMSPEDVNIVVDIMKRRRFSEEEELNFTESLLGKFPNTYTFTKSIAEGILNEKAKNLPFCIYRFSIALTTFKEPIPGWTDAAQGFNQALIGIGIGVIRVMCLKPNANVDLVPVDFVCNGLIAAAWETGTSQRKATEDLSVYNYVSSTDNPLSWNDFRTYVREYGSKHAPKSIVYYPDTIFLQSEIMFAIFNFILHLLPTLLGDVILRLLGKKPILHKIYKKGTKLLKITSFFRQHQWTFDTRNVRLLWKNLSQMDKELFLFNIKSFNWRDPIFTTCDGIQKYLMKEDMSPKSRKIAKRKYNILYTLHQILRFSFVAFILWFAWRIYYLIFVRQ